MNTENKTFDIATLKVNQLPHIAGIEAKQKELVKENPFIEIVDGTTEKLAKSRRTALKGGGTEIMNGDKALASGLVKFRKECKTEAERLSVITLEARTKQQTEIDRWEQIKTDKKEAAAKAEALRIENIKGEIKSLSIKLREQTDSLVFAWIDTIDKKFYGIIESTRIDAQDFTEELVEMVSSEKLLFETKVIRVRDEEEKRLELIKAKELAAEQAKELEAIKEEARKKEEASLVEFNKLKDKQRILDAENKIIQDKKDEAARIEREKFEQDRKQFEADKKELEDAQKEVLRKTEEAKQLIIDADKKKLADEKIKADLIKKQKADVKRQAELKPLKTDVIKRLEEYVDLWANTENKEIDSILERFNNDVDNLKTKAIEEINNL